MAPNLPKGLITNSSGIAQDIRALGCFTNGEIKTLWKAYSTNKRLLPDDIGVRLEHLFWRIWGSDRLRRSVTGSTVSKLFDEICYGRGFRTTPVPSPRIQAAQPAPLPTPLSTPLGSDEFEAQPPPSRRSTRLLPPNANGQDESAIDDEPAPLPQSRRGSRADSTSVQFSLPTERRLTGGKPSSQTERPKVSVPQSILKKPRQQSQPGSATDLARIREEPKIAGKLHEHSRLSGASTISDLSPTDDSARKLSIGSHNGSSSRKKRTAFAVGSNGRKRPSFARRKSSQSSASASASALVEQSDSLSQSSTTSGEPREEKSIVEQGFRTKFAKQHRPENHFSQLRRDSNPKTLSTVAATSTAVSGTLALGGASGDIKGKGKAKAAPHDKDPSTEPQASDATRSSDQMSRTKSQLTLLLEKDRKRNSISE